MSARDPYQIEHTFPAVCLPEVEAKIAKATATAIRLGATPPVVTFTHRKVTEKRGGRDQVKHLIDMVATIAPVAFAGWNLRARIEHSAAGTLVHCVPGHTVPASYREAKPTCDHCQAKRTRKDTFILQHDDGRWFSVGRQCIADFLGHNVNLYVFERGLRALDDGEFFGGLRDRPADPTLITLAVCRAVINAKGFRPRSRCQEGETPTSSYVAVVLNPPNGPSEEDKKDREFATAIWKALTPEDDAFAIECRQHWAGITARGEFDDNCKKLVAADVAEHKHLGLIAAAVNSFIRFQGIETERRIARTNDAASQYVGELKKRQDFAVTCGNVIAINTDFGALYIHKFRDAAGNVIVWKTGTTKLEPGKSYAIRATPMRHEEYKGIKQTTVNRADVKP